MVVICQFVYLHKLAMNNVFICKKYSVLTRMVLTYEKQALLFRHSGQKHAGADYAGMTFFSLNQCHSGLTLVNHFSVIIPLRLAIV